MGIQGGIVAEDLSTAERQFLSNRKGRGTEGSTVQLSGLTLQPQPSRADPIPQICDLHAAARSVLPTYPHSLRGLVLVCRRYGSPILANLCVVV